MSTKKRLIILAGVVVVLIAIVVISVNARRQDAVSVQTSKVERVPKLVSKVTATGEIKPKEFVELQAEITGVITELYVKEGDFVKKSDLLLTIDPTQTQAETRAQQALVESALIDASNQQAQIALQETNLGRERSNIIVAQAEVTRAQQALETSRSNFERRQNLYEDNLISKDLYEVARNEMVAAESGLTAAEARLEQAKAQLSVAEVVLQQNKNSYRNALTRVDQNRAILSRVQDSLSKTTIRSPLTGVITQLNVEVGERAVPGTLNNPSATIMVIADLSVIEAEVEVDETDIVHVELGQEAEIRVDALPGSPLKGTVTEIGNSAIQRAGQSQEAKDFKVAVRLNDPPPTLRPGLSCTADITTAVREDVITIPIQALTVREFPVDEEGKPIIAPPKTDSGPESSAKKTSEKPRKEFEGVFLVVEKKAKFVPITTGITGDTEIEVMTGIDEDSTIVTGSYKILRSLKDGDPVKVGDQERS